MSEQTQTRIDPQEVERVFLACFWTGEELKTAEKNADGIPKDAIVVEGITSRYAFHPHRVEEQRAKVTEWLKALPRQFRKNDGGGWSFLNACNQENGEQWTGLHERMEQLFVLGMALDLVECQVPREMWKAFPGGMPYYVIDIE